MFIYDMLIHYIYIYIYIYIYDMPRERARDDDRVREDDRQGICQVEVSLLNDVAVSTWLLTCLMQRVDQ